MQSGTWWGVPRGAGYVSLPGEHAQETSHQPRDHTVAPGATHVRNAFFTAGDAPSTCLNMHCEGITPAGKHPLSP